MLNKQIFHLLINRAVISPFEFMEFRLQTGIEILPYHQYPLIECADQISIYEGETVFWNGLAVDLIRNVISYNILKYKNRRQDRINNIGFSSFILEVLRYINNSIGHCISILLKTDQLNKFQNSGAAALSHFLETKGKFDIFLIMGLYTTGSILSGYLRRKISKNMNFLQARNFISRFFRSFIVKIFSVSIVYPIFTITNKMIVRDQTFTQAFKEGAFYEGFRVVTIKIVIEYILAQISYKVLRQF